MDKKLSNDFQNDDNCILAKLNYTISLKNLKPRPECLVKQNWGSVDPTSHIWKLHKNISATIDQIRCKYRKISRVDDFQVLHGEFKDLLEGDKILDDVFEVECNGSKKNDKGMILKKFENLYVQVVDIEIEKKTLETISDKNGCFPYDVMLISYDSVSRVSFINRLKKTFEFINQSYNFFILNGYNIVGDGTPAGLVNLS